MRFEFKTVEGVGEGVYVEKGSKFMASSYAIKNAEETKVILQQIKSHHLKARHVCYAYRLGINGEIYKTDDDGEPSGTAGKPILGQLIKNDLSNTMVVVVRYFGGILLGSSGLSKAYKAAATDCLNQTKQIVVPIIQLYQIETDQNHMYKIIHLAKTYDVAYQNLKIDIESSIELSIPLQIKKMFFTEMKKKIELTEEGINLDNLNIAHCRVQILNNNACFKLD